MVGRVFRTIVAEELKFGVLAADKTKVSLLICLAFFKLRRVGSDV